MSTIKNQLAQLKEADIYSLLLFALYKMHELPEYSALSELSFLLDKDSLLKMCSTMGGCTITIPTIDDLQILISALMLYNNVNIKGESFDTAIQKYYDDVESVRKLKSTYLSLVEILNDYKFSSRA